MDTVQDLLARKQHLKRLPEPAVRRLIRKQAGLSQEELAQALGVDRASVSRYEHGGRFPRTEIAERYVTILDALVQSR